MRRSRLTRQVIPAYLLVIVCSTVAVAWYAGESVRTFHEKQLAEQLSNKAKLLVPQVHTLITAGRLERLADVCSDLGRASSTRITVIDPEGNVLAESERDPVGMDNHANRPEVLDAMAGKVGRSVRYSTSIQARMMYVAVPIDDAGKVAAVVRTAVTMDEVHAALANVYWRIGLGGAATAVVAMLLTSYLFARRVGHPLKLVQQGARRFARGDLERSIPVPEAEEIATLAEVLNAMAGQLRDKIEALTRESREHDAILSGMVEGVVAIDNDQRVIIMNQSAAQLVGVPMNDAVGHSVFEVVRNPDLQTLFKRSLDDKSYESDATVCLSAGGRERFVQAHAAPLRDADGHGVGAVIVLHDITKLRRLEKVRQDFVANVSHELKTPITAIKGAAETILDGDCDRTQSEHFAAMIQRQSERLHAIVEDLLSLARIEQESERGLVKLERGPVEPVLAGAAEACHTKAHAKQINVLVEPSPGLQAMINPHLLEQAVVNLLDNAIKYSGPRTQIRVVSERRDGRLLIEVTDQGSGIVPEHQGRIFERFYRTDRARSRDAGGTGLGLAIVKHIAQAHGGQVDMESTLGVGSTFRIWLPLD